MTDRIKLRKITRKREKKKEESIKDNEKKQYNERKSEWEEREIKGL